MMLKLKQDAHPGVSEVKLVQDDQMEFSLSAMGRLIQRQWPLILSVAGAILALGIVYLLVVPPKFTGTIMILIDTHKNQLLEKQQILADPQLDASAIDSQVEVLKSDSVVGAVVRDLKLTEVPEFNGSDVNPVHAAISWVMSLIASPGEPLTQDQIEHRSIDILDRKLTVKRVQLTYVIELDVMSYDAELAAKIANAFAEAYLVSELDAKYETTKRASKWLNDRISELREQATLADRDVQTFKAANNIVDTTRGLLTEQQLSDANSQLTQARTATAEAKAKLDRITKIGNSDLPDATVTDALHSDVISRLRAQYLDLSAREADWSSRYGANHMAAINLRNQMRELKHSLAEELKRIAETYKSDFEITQAREQTLQRDLAKLIDVAGSSSQAQVQLHNLESNAQTYRNLYDDFLQRFMEATQQQTFPINEARIIAKAVKPEQRTSPKAIIVLPAALFAGLLLGFGSAYGRERLDNVFRTSLQVELTAGIECLGIFPKVRAGGEKKSRDNNTHETDRAGRSHIDMTPQIGGASFARFVELVRTVKLQMDAKRLRRDGHLPPAGNVRPHNVPLRAAGADTLGIDRKLPQDTGLYRHITDAPFSRFAEILRAIKVQVDIGRLTRETRVIGIVSSLPHEGKTTIAANLAHLLAQNGNRCLLIDGDLRRRSLSRELMPLARAGLLEVLDGAVLADVLWHDDITHLDLLPTVADQRFANATEILSSPKLAHFLSQMRECYEYIIVDLPPAIPVVDVKAASHLIDGFVFVIEWGVTPKDIVLEALDQVELLRERMLGAVLNKADPAALKRLERYRGRYYSSYYRDAAEQAAA